MSLINKLTTNGSNLTIWDGTTPPQLKNSIVRGPSQMHAENTGVPTDGYSLDGSPNLQTQKSDYFRYDSPEKNASLILALPAPTILDQQQSPLFITHYPGDGELGGGRYKLGAPEGRGFLVNGL